MGSPALFKYYHQPFRTFFVAYKLAQLVFVYIPFWFCLYLIPWFRPVRTWPWYRALSVRIVGHVFGLLATSGVDSIPSHDYTNLDTSFGTKGVWIPPIPHLIDGSLATWCGVAKVESIRIPGYWIDQPGRNTPMGYLPRPNEKVLLMLHGGAFIGGSAHPWSPLSILPRKLLKHIGLARRAFAVEYRLSRAAPLRPRNPFPAALVDALAGYDYLVNSVGFSPSNIIIVGDSAGANLALALVRYLVDNQSIYHKLPSPPGSLILISPWTDLSAKNLRYKCTTDYVGHPEVLRLFGWAKQAYTGPHGIGSASYNPYISPASNSLQSHATYGFPRTFITAGSAEYLIEQQRALKNHMREYTEVTYHEAPGMVHDFVSFPYVCDPEANEALREIGKWTSVKKASNGSVPANGHSRHR